MLIGSDNNNESTSSSNESHEVNGDTSNGEGSEGRENGDGDTPPNTTPCSSRCVIILIYCTVHV